MAVSDACAAVTTEEHEASLKNMQWQGGVCNTAQVEEVSYVCVVRPFNNL